MAILESVKELASKLGAETNGRDITDQLNKINKHLDETALSGRDIAEAVKTYSKNASGGGGGGETFEVNAAYDDTTGTIIADKTKTEAISAYNNGANVVFKVNIGKNYTSMAVVPILDSDGEAINSLYGINYILPNSQLSNKLYASGFYYSGESTMDTLQMADIN